MGFIVMVLSIIIGIFLIVLGFYRIKNKKSRIWNIFAILVGIVLVLFSVWLAFPK